MISSIIMLISLVIFIVLVLFGIIYFYNKANIGKIQLPQNLSDDNDILDENTTNLYYQKLKPHYNVMPSARINLFIDYYSTGNKIKQQEIDFVLSTNLKNHEFYMIYIIVHSKIDLKTVSKKFNDYNKIIVEIKTNTTYGKIFELINTFSGPDDINIFANSDIAFDESINEVRRLRSNEALALTSWNIKSYNNPSIRYINEIEAIIDENGLSKQDVWIIRGKAPKELEDIDFTALTKRADNRIAYILSEVAGYQLFNPCENIKTYRFNKSQVGSYQSNKLAGPGLYLPPCSWS